MCVADARVVCTNRPSRIRAVEEVQLSMAEGPDNEPFERLVATLRSSDLLERIEAAEALGRLGDRRAVEPLIAALEDPEWRACLTAVKVLGELGDASAAGPIVQVLRRKDASEGFISRAVEFADTVTTALQKLGEAGFQSLLQVVREFAEYEFPGVAVVVTLGEIADPRALDALLFALHSSVYEVADAAARALSGFGEMATAPLISLLREPDDGPYFHARRALRWIGPAAIPPLLYALNDADDADLRADIIEVLGAYDDERVLGPLHQALSDLDEGVREEAAFALGKRRDPSAIEQLLLTPQRNSGSNLSAMTLAEIGEPAVEPLIEVLGDPRRPAHPRVNAATALGEIGDARALEALLAALRADDPAVRWAAAGALGDLKDPHAVGPLLAALDDSEASARARMAQALGMLQDDRAFKAVVAVATNGREHFKVRQSAISALGSGREDRALPVLRDIIMGEDPLAASLAINALIGHGTNAIPTLLETASLEDRRRVLMALGPLRMLVERERDLRIIEFLVAALQNRDPRIRHQVAIMLGRVGDQRAMDTLIEALRGRDITVRQQVAWILADIGDERAIPVLEQAYADSINTSAEYADSARWAEGDARDAFQRANLAIRARLRSLEHAPDST